MKHIEEMKAMLSELLRISTLEVEAGIEKVDTEELYKVVDMIKDLSEALYYMSIVNGMEHGESIKFEPMTESRMERMKMYE